ncbi:DUF4129 domain-containing transglutaminase family protein [Alkalihalobacterium bogoriense]|uniref:DUF4129 domain-containing transglutaminase family protein n=1 Tax=Alkalihalobacterium bogoriense TaxID=246272 RepID=UPI000479D489|nr:transglutaminase domain-containing protein [Alkalihalobacterium bogoriense]
MRHEQNRQGNSFGLYVLGLLLFLEWMYPLPYVTDTGYISIFVIFTFIFFVITYCQLRVWLSFLLKCFFIGYGLHVMFFSEMFLSLGWFSIFLDDVTYNLSLMVAGQWNGLTDIFRSLLFFILLAVMSYLIFYWTTQLKRILLFFVFTIIYITFIDTFTLYDAGFAIVRTFLFGFLLLGLLTMYRVIEREKVGTYSKVLPARLVVSLIVIVSMSASLGYAAPKFDPQWGDPVPYMKSAFGLNPNAISPAQTIGYGTNDERLGGGFDMDETPVFYATASKPHYWRGESKDFYTGRGWEQTTPEILGEQSNFYEPQVPVETLEAQVEMTGNHEFDHLFYPGDLTNVSSEENPSVYIDQFTGKAFSYDIDMNSFVLPLYQIEYGYPEYSRTALREDSGEDPEEIKQYYLQLPETLPERVTTLAETIVANQENRYDKARTIERYFTMAGFQYETRFVAVPGPGEDYVDQFLFETQRGYCDNFSTSMVVLLRSVGIPARWVKGFTQGERLEYVGEDSYQYEVTNANAHSWVEVYFADSGWVPFEPTRGFEQPIDFTSEWESRDADVDIEQLQERYDEEVEEVMAPVDENQTPILGGRGGASVSISLIPLLVSLSVLSLFAFIAFYNRKKIIIFYMLFRYQSKQGEDTFNDAYATLLWLLQFVGMKKNEGETMREYAKRVDSLYSMDEMTALTANYERVSYGNAPSEKLWSESRRLWKTIVRRIGS